MRGACSFIVQHVPPTGRVDRADQKQPTYVHRFIVRDSVEDVVVALASKRAQETGVGPMPVATRAAAGVSGAGQDGEGVITRGDVISMFRHKDNRLV